MVARLVGAALKHSAVVLVLAVALVVVGVWTARNAPLDVFPEFAPPIVEVQTEAPGFAAEDVEALVTTPLERALGGTPGVDDDALVVRARPQRRARHLRLRDGSLSRAPARHRGRRPGRPASCRAASRRR